MVINFFSFGTLRFSQWGFLNINAFSWWLRLFLEWLKLFQFFLGGGWKVDKISANYTLKPTKLYHLKRVSRECMPPERLANVETLSNIYSKLTILKEFSGEHAFIPLTSAEQYHIYIPGRVQKNFVWGASSKMAPHMD